MITKTEFNPECITYSQMNLIFNSRIYYRRLTTWTRAYIISKFFGIGSDEELFGRLYLESLEIGNMLQIVFGREYAEQYSSLVSQFAIAFRDLLAAQLAGDTEAIDQNVARIFQNAKDRAAYLAALNPYWSEAEYTELLSTYFRLILEEVNAIITGGYSRDIELYNILTAHTNRMGDTFAQGLYDYITSGSQETRPQSTDQCITFEQMDDIYEIRMFWYELVFWVRNYMLSRYKEIGNVDEVYARLKEVPVQYVDRLKDIFGVQIEENYIELFNTFIDLLDAFITAQMEGNNDKVAEITMQLYQNANDRAAFIASINPYWDEEVWRNRLDNNLRSTIEESTTFLTEDYPRNISIFSRLLDQAESTSTYFAQGLFRYINSQKL